MAKIRWTVEARRGLHEIINCIAEDSPAYAVNFAERIILAVDRLETFSKLGRIVPEYQDPNLRALIASHYRSCTESKGPESGLRPSPMQAVPCSENSHWRRGISAKVRGANQQALS